MSDKFWDYVGYTMKTVRETKAIDLFLAQCGNESMEWRRMWPKGEVPKVNVFRGINAVPNVELLDLRDWPQYFEAIPHETGTAYHFTAEARRRVLSMPRPV